MGIVTSELFIQIKSTNLQEILSKLYEMTAFGELAAEPMSIVMLLLGFLMLYLGIAKKFEPLLLVPIGFGVLLAKPILHVMQQPQEVVELAIPYLNLVAASLIPLIVFQSFKQFSDGMSMTKYPMIATLIANIINVVLNYIFIFGKFQKYMKKEYVVDGRLIGKDVGETSAPQKFGIQTINDLQKLYYP